MTDTSYKPAISQHQGGTVPLPTRAGETPRATRTMKTRLDPADLDSSGPSAGAGSSLGGSLHVSGEANSVGKVEEDGSF